MIRAFKPLNFFFILITFFILIPNSAKAQEYIQPIVVIPANKTELIDQYQKDFSRIRTSLGFVQQRYSELLGGPTFKLLEPQIFILNQTSSLPSISYSAIQRAISEYKQFFDTENRILMFWSPGLEGHNEKFNLNGQELNGILGGFNGKVMIEDKLFNVVWLPDSNFQELVTAAYGDTDSKGLKTVAHEIGHAYGLPHPCTVETTVWCEGEQLQTTPLPPASEAKKSIMGYNDTPLNSAIFNNSFHNPEIKILLENSSLNPEGLPYPKPDDIYLYKEGISLITTQLNVYPDAKNPIHIKGNKFGDEKGGVELTLLFPGFGVEQTIEVPDNLIEWSNDLITVSLPEDFIGTPMAVRVTIIQNGRKIPIDGEIAIYNSSSNTLLAPELLKNNSEAIIPGNDFGDVPGEVVFSDFAGSKPTPQQLPVTSWSNDKIVVYLSLPPDKLYLSILVLRNGKGGIFAGALQLEANNSTTQDVFFQVQLQCADQGLKPKPGDISLFIDDNLGLLSPVTSGLTDPNGYISFLTPVTFNYGEPRKFTFTLNRDGATTEQVLTVDTQTPRVDVPINDPSCGTPVESYSILISNNPAYNDNDFRDGSGTLQVSGQQNPQSFDWITSAQGDGTIFISKITLNGNEEFQITGTKPGDQIDIPATNIKLSIKQADQSIVPPTDETPSQVSGSNSCNPNPWSDEETDSENYRCDGDQACYAMWQEDSDNSCQPKQIGEDCKYKQECAGQIPQPDSNTASCEPSSWKDEQPYSCQDGWACYYRWKITGGSSCDPERDYGEDGQHYICVEDSNCQTVQPGGDS